MTTRQPPGSDPPGARSQRTAVEAALAASEARWRSLVEQAPTLVVETDESGTVTFVNRGVTGRPLGSMIGRPIFEFTEPEHRVACVHAFTQAVAGRKAVAFTHFLRRADGGIIWLDSLIAPVVRDGKIDSVIIISTDVTRRVEAEAGLRESEQRFRDIVESMGDWYWEMDAVGRMTSTSEHSLQMLGRTPAQMLGHSPVEFAAPDDQARQRQYLAEHGTPPRPIRDFTGWYLHPDGKRVCIAVSGVPVFAPDGALAGWRGVARDVTPQFEARRALAESEQRFRAIVETMGDWLVECDPAWRVVFSTPQVEQLLGYTAEEMLGKSPLETVLPEGRERLGAMMAEFVGRRRPLRDVEVWHARKDGGRVCLSVSGGPLLDAEGRLRGMRAVVHDVTERKREEEERRAIEAKMQQAQKFESLGILAGGIAHDFNNLLTAVLGNADLALAELPPDAPARESVEQIQKASLHAAELTRQMLAYAGRGSITVQPVSLRDLVRDMAQLLGSSISKRHALVLDLAEGLPAVEADPAQLRQIVMNLVINASEAIGDADGAINVRAGALGPGQKPAGDLVGGEAGGTRRVLLEVTDTGEGMDAATLPRVFDPFFSTKFAGRGLGLPVVLGIVRRHGGAVSVRSARGAGSTFSVVLPAMEGGRPAPPAPRPGSAEAWRGAGTLLLVDDEAPVRDMAERMLRAMGFEVVPARDGVEALALLEEHGTRIRAVLLDLTMPRMDGEETLRHIRATAPELPVLLCSGYDLLERQGRFAELAASGFIQKPFRLADLQRALRRALRE